MHEPADDTPNGQLFTRRAALAWLAGTALLAAAQGARAAVPCVARPAQTEGPFFVDRIAERSDIAAGTAGVPLALAFQVMTLDHGTCAPLAGAHVDVWHCDAAGVYSGVETRGVGATALRGWQRSDASGIARFATIVPGWYQGRAVHLHFKVRTQGAGGRARDFTSQLYFDPALLRRVYTLPPYAARGGRFVPNDDDFLFRDGGGQLLLDTRAAGAGYTAVFPLALQAG